MKSFLVFILILIIICFAAIITKPSDEQCIELAKSNVNTAIYNSSQNSIVKGIESTLIDIGVNKVFFRIEDNFLYKTIYSKFDNSKVGIVLFGMFINVGNNLASNTNNTENFPNSAGNNNRSNEIRHKRKEVPKPANETTYETNPLESAKAELYAAKDRMRKIKEFHVLRTPEEREQQIKQQEQYILSLENKISVLEGNNVTSLPPSEPDDTMK